MEFSEDISGGVQTKQEGTKGWLLIFKIINVFFIVMLPLLLAVVVGLAITSDAPISVDYGLVMPFLEALPSFVFSLLIYNAMKSRDKASIFLIKRLLTIEFVIKVVVSAVVYSVGKHVFSEPGSSTSFLMYIAYFAIWHTYFSKSKRVQGYFNHQS